MSRNAFRLLAAALALGGAACAKDSLAPGNSLLDLAGAFSSVPVGYNYAQSSFDGTVGGSAWMPHSDHFGGGLMGTGLGSEFRGLGFGHGGPGMGFGGPFGALGSDCTFNAGSGRVECPALTMNGLTITRSVAFSDAAGKPQSAYDSVTTNTINTRVSVSGTAVRRADDRHGEHGRGPGGPGRDGMGMGGGGMGRGSSGSSADDSIVVTVQNASDRTVSGLARGSTKRTINGTSAGKESFSATDSIGAFTALRVVGDTTRDVVIPVPAAGSATPSYPTAGTVIRSMQATITYTGKTPQTRTRREVITYDGSATAKLVITEDGSTKNCTIALPHGRPVCQ